MPSAPLQISSQSKKKLKAFSFNGREAKENEENRTVPNTVIRNDPSDSHSIPVTSPRPFKPESNPPQTPAPRIPLAHLIGNTEDAYYCAPPAATPSDHVLWQDGPRSSNPLSSFHSTQRGKKRARSSSPTSSQLDRSSGSDPSREPLDLESIQKSLRTPQHDPAAELWSRYTSDIKTMTRSENIFTNFGPSSPQTPSTTNSKDSILRRTMSCGVEWPMPSVKRRRIHQIESYERTKGIFAAAKKEILARELAKPSRVGLLVEKIQESLSKRRVEESQEPSSSSPLPDRREVSDCITTVSHQKTPSNGDDTAADPNRHLSTPSKDITLSHEEAINPPSSDYGDDEIDLEFVETFEWIATQGKLSQGEASRQPNPADRVQDICPPQKIGEQVAIESDTRQRSLDLPQSKSAALETCHSDDFLDVEFADEDEGFTNELQQLVDQMDSQQKPTLTNGFEQQAMTQNGSWESSKQQVPTELDDSFEEDDELWNAFDETTVIKQGETVGSMSHTRSDNRTIKRYLIAEIVDSHYANSQGRRRPEKILSVKDENTDMLRVILLRQSWYDTKCTKRSYVHLIGDFDRSGQCIVDDTNNMIILHPDHLISATVVADSFTCTRRAALQDRIKTTGAATESQVLGHIIHAVFGEALETNAFDTHQLRAIIEKILPNYIEALYEIQLPIPEAIDRVMGKMPELKAWASVFISPKPFPDAIIRDRNGSTTWMAINKLLAVEEHIWSPMYGLKGNIDATIQVVMKTPADDVVHTLAVPFELKTGKKDSNETHRAQTALYTLLMSDRYDISVTCGILYYLETSKTFRIESIRNEIRHMVIQRNELACYVHEKLDLPPMIRKQHLCRSCYARVPCFTYHRLVENGDGESSGLNEAFEQAVDHLKPQHQEFFRKWDFLLTLEERDTMKFRRELWAMLSQERESVGRCFSNVVIEPGSASEDVHASKINRYHYAFIKHRHPNGFSFTESQLSVGEPIVISDENGHFALANGYVTNVRPTRLTVAVDRKLHHRRRASDFDPIINQDFSGIMEVTANGTSFVPQPPDPDDPLLYRIDKDEFINGMATARNNLIRIMEKDLFRARDLRELIIEDRAPTFKPVSTAYTLSGPASQQDLNVDQRRAIDKVMSARDYALVLGMPGTGKTTTIAHIIRALVSQNKSVLLTSYTHTAVDNILLKIKDDSIPVLRLGSVARVHPEVRAFADLGGIPKTTLSELENAYVNSKVVATTCLGVNERIFNARTFDYCIVDEASQITLPVCLGPIRMARTFILVGDHFQLPPLVQNRTAQENGLDVSLFKLLSEGHPEAVVNLEHQYRMAEDIMFLSNELVYNGWLKCGTPNVANRMLDIPNLENGLAAHHHTPTSIPRFTTPSSICTGSTSCWLRQALNPQSRCLFLDTDSMGQVAREQVSGGSRITNPTETRLTAHLVTVLTRAGVSPRSIGIITFYRSQLALLRQEVRSTAGTAAAAELEMHTADKFQGRDKEVVVMSCVRSNDAHSIGDLLKDWRRVNVAVTRAKSKLVILGSRATLGNSQNETLQGLIRIMANKNWVVSLPTAALEEHAFQYTMTQATGQLRGGGSCSHLASSSLGNEVLDGSQKRSGRRTILREANNNGATKRETSRIPGKVVQGMVDVNKLLDRRPVLRDIANEILNDVA